jgi:hypothetical protein
VRDLPSLRNADKIDALVVTQKLQRFQFKNPLVSLIKRHEYVRRRARGQPPFSCAEGAGLMRRERLGRIHQLKLEATPMRKASQWIEEYRRFWDQRLDRLEDYPVKLQTREKKHGNE